MRPHSPGCAGIDFWTFSIAQSCFLVLRRGKQARGCPSVLPWFSFCWGRLHGSCRYLSRFLSHTWQWMITQVSLAVAYGGSLEIHPWSFQLVISLYMEGEETKNSGSDECRVNMLSFFRDRAKASQAAHPISLVTLCSPGVGVGFLPLSTVTPPWLVGWGRADLRFFFFSFSAWLHPSLWLSSDLFLLPGSYLSWYLLFTFSSFFHSLWRSQHIGSISGR